MNTIYKNLDTDIAYIITPIKKLHNYKQIWYVIFKTPAIGFLIFAFVIIMEKPKAVQYIKQLSSIPNEFIDDLFEFYDSNTMQTDFAINLDKVCKWFQVPKSKLMETLKNSPHYKEGVDYKVTKATNPNKKHPQSNNYKQVLLTPDCFKHLAMMTRAKKGHTIRSYFIEIENLFIKYRKQTLMGMQQEIETLERNLKPRNSEPRAGYIYVVRASENKDSVYKIGRTKDLQARLRSHRSALADDMEVLYRYRTDNIEAVEKCTHSWLKKYQYRKYKEVFQINLNIIKQVIMKCGNVEHAFELKLEEKNTSKSGAKMTGGLYMVSVVDS